MAPNSSILALKIPWAEEPMGCKGLDMTEHTYKLVINLYVSNICLPFTCFIFQFSSSVMSIESVMPSSHLILCCPLLLLPSIFPSIRVFSNESVASSAQILELQHQSYTSLTLPRECSFFVVKFVYPPNIGSA